MNKNTYHAIGLMSGSSLDGLDICYVEFLADAPQTIAESGYTIDNRGCIIHYRILQAECIEYSNEFREQLRNASNLPAFEFAQLHTEIGKHFGKLTNDFIQKYKINNIDFICSHGQTIFHQPAAGFTTQIGCGAQIAAQTNCKVVCDLRTSDIAYGGQGAPIVPVTEKYLFPEFDVFLNIGGIANMAFHERERIIAYDICAANTLLNYLAKQKKQDYDKDGNLARSGNTIPDLLNELNGIAFCKQPAPKSLGTEHIINDWFPLIEKYDHSIEDKLATAVEHIAIQVSKSTPSQISDSTSQILITGGGALNSFLVERIQHHTSLKVTIPDVLTVQYKEALAMAFTGFLRILEIPNCLASVTGAQKNVIGGAVYLP